MKIKVGTIFLRIVIAVVALAVAGLSVYGQADKKKTKIATPFSWVSPASGWKAKTLPKNVRHNTFKSPSMSIDVGYYVYLPDGYDAKKNKKKVPRSLSSTWQTARFGKQNRFPRDLYREGHEKWKDSTHHIRLSKRRPHELV